MRDCSKICVKKKIINFEKTNLTHEKADKKKE